MPRLQTPCPASGCCLTCTLPSALSRSEQQCEQGIVFPPPPPPPAPCKASCPGKNSNVCPVLSSSPPDKSTAMEAQTGSLRPFEPLHPTAVLSIIQKAQTMSGQSNVLGACPLSPSSHLLLLSCANLIPFQGPAPVNSTCQHAILLCIASEMRWCHDAHFAGTQLLANCLVHQYRLEGWAGACIAPLDNSVPVFVMI